MTTTRRHSDSPPRGDLAAPVGRCAEGAVSPEEALDWLVADGGTPTPATVPSEADRDGDGVENGADPDNDGDGIGDHLDSDNDGDGVPDSAEDEPQGGAGSAAMRLQELQRATTDGRVRCLFSGRECT